MPDSPAGSVKIALVTGGARGIGQAIVERLASSGWKVMFTYNASEEAAHALADSLRSAGAEVATTRLAVEDLRACEEAAQQTEKAFGGLSALINNAGLVSDAAFMRMAEEQWRSVLDVELVGTLNMTRACISMLRRSEHASIVNLGSLIGQRGNAGQANHAAAKAGVIGFTYSLAQELGPLGVRVNCVSPGFIDTSVLANVPERNLKKTTARIPLRRLGQPSEVADLVEFLVSERACYITGQDIGINGGLASAC